MEATSTVTEDCTTNALLESLDIPAILLDSGDIVAEANELALLILEMDRRELIGQHFFELDDRKHHYHQLCGALERGRSLPPGEQQCEVSLHVRGREHVYLLKLSRTRIGLNTLGTLLTLYDVSYQRAQQRAYGNLIATLSDGLRTPLTSLSLGIELLQRGRRDKSKDHIITAVVEDLERIRSLSDDLLARARDTLLSIPVRSVAVDFSDMVNAISKEFIFDARQKQVALHIHVEAGIQSSGDPVKLSWVVSSLIGNALRCTPSGGSILVSAGISGESIRLSVSDSGEAIPHGIVEFALEKKSQQLTDSLSSDRRGLELAIANEIVDAHGGRILVDASPRSTTFVVDLPYVRRV